MITIVYDNNPGRSDLTPAWGFACVVQGLGKTILFDTGGDGRVLLTNMRKLGIEPNQVDAVVISHTHGDHTGGLTSFLRSRGGVPVYMPMGFPASFKEQARAQGGQPVEAEASAQVCAGAKTTGTLGKGAIEEHGLCVKTPAGCRMDEPPAAAGDRVSPRGEPHPTRGAWRQTPAPQRRSETTPRDHAWRCCRR